MSPTSSLQGAVCGKHAGVPAVEICSRCGTFLCGECVEYFQETTPSCASCLPFLKGGVASMRSRLAPMLATVALFALVAGFFVRGRPGLGIWALSLPIGFAGLAFGVQELRLIREGQTGAAGRRWGRAGVVLGVLYALGFALLVAGFLLFTWRTYVSATPQP